MRLKLTSMTKIINIMNNPEIIIVHPGEILREDFLVPLNLSKEELAESIKIAPATINSLLAGKCDLDKELATRLALYFDMSTEF